MKKKHEVEAEKKLNRVVKKVERTLKVNRAAKRNVRTNANVVYAADATPVVQARRSRIKWSVFEANGDVIWITLIGANRRSLTRPFMLRYYPGGKDCAALGKRSISKFELWHMTNEFERKIHQGIDIGRDRAYTNCVDYLERVGLRKAHRH